MGRAKLEMELISKEKSRNTTFKKRKEGLIRKLHEFTTLCDVKACMIIYGPTGGAEAEIWPQNSDQVRRIIDIYKIKNKDSGIKSYGVADFFHEREKKIEEELTKMRKKNIEAKYPPMPTLLNDFTAAQLREFNGLLRSKIDHVKARIEFLRRRRQSTTPQAHGTTRFHEMINHHHHNQHNQQQMMMNQNHAVEMQVPIVDPNSMMMFWMNDGGASTSSNVQVQRQVFFEAPRPVLARYYAPPLPPLPPLPQQYVLPPLFSNLEGVQEPGFVQYQMRNQTPGSQN